LNRFNHGILLEATPLRKLKMEPPSATRCLRLSFRAGENLPQAGYFFAQSFPVFAATLLGTP
jgi:hypothetical protein